MRFGHEPTSRLAHLVVSLPHTGTDIPAEYENGLVSPWLARKDADWWIERLYDFVAGLGATVIRTSISRTVIDVNRDPSGISLYHRRGVITAMQRPPLAEAGAGYLRERATLRLK